MIKKRIKAMVLALGFLISLASNTVKVQAAGEDFSKPYATTENVFIDENVSRDELKAYIGNKMEKNPENVVVYTEGEILKGLQIHTDEELKKTGFSDEQIENIRNYNDDAIMARGYAPNRLKVYLDQNVYYYSKSAGIDGKTVFQAVYHWEWEQKPTYTLTDIIGIGWDDYYRLSSGNGYMEYYSANDTYLGDSYFNLVSEDFRVASHKFDMNVPKSGTWGTPRSGYGVVTVERNGRETNISMVFKYGHQEIRIGDPSISIPAGVGFAIKNVTNVVPSRMIYGENFQERP